MRIAIPTQDPNGLEAIVSPNFARTPFITIVDLNGGMKASSNPNSYAQGGGGVGPMVAQQVMGMGVQTVIAPSVGPNALGALASAGISVYTCPPGVRVREVVEMFKAGNLSPAISSQPPAMGMGPGMGGMGRGRGMGGWGRGGGKGGGWGRRRGGGMGW